MSPESPRICIVGAGAIGGVTAGLLARQGIDITLVTKYPELADKISIEGLKISGFHGEFNQKVPAVPTTTGLEGKYDYFLLATKANALKETAAELLSSSSDTSRFVSMQNGICEGMLAEVVGEERTIGCVVGWGATMHEYGHVEMTSDGDFILGNWERNTDPELSGIAEILGHIVPTQISDNILSDLYAKLIINSCITTLGAVCGLYLGEMLASAKVRNLFIGVIREAINVADGMNLKVAPGAGGKLDYYKFLSSGPLSGFKRHLTIRVIGMKYRKLKSSSLQSLERGQKTEVNNYNGYISEMGKEGNIPTPINDKLVEIIHEIEDGSRKISPANFNEF